MIMSRGGNTTRHGTAYFPSLKEAVGYFTPYESGYCKMCGALEDGKTQMEHVKDVVQRKIKNGEIHIGKPPTTEHQTAYLVDEKPGFRWWVADIGGHDVRPAR